MRPSRLIPMLMVALAAAGCMHTSAPDVTAAPNGEPIAAAAPADLDSLAYERRITASMASHAQVQPQVRQLQATPAAMQANAQVVVPVVAQPSLEPAYVLDTGDKLRIVVFGQDGLSNSYFVDAAGQVTIPLIGAVNGRGLTTQQLARAVAAKLRAG